MNRNKYDWWESVKVVAKNSPQPESKDCNTFRGIDLSEDTRRLCSIDVTVPVNAKKVTMTFPSEVAISSREMFELRRVAEVVVHTMPDGSDWVVKDRNGAVPRLIKLWEEKPNK